jgi:regulator of protease activity HflC (stomatin/prohibitin superfamily)
VLFFVLFTILVAVGLACFFAIPPFLGDGKTDPDTGAAKLAVRALTVVVGGVLIAILAACTSTHAIPAGHVGVVYGIGGDISGQRENGLQFTAPWQTVKVVSVQQQTYRPETKCSTEQENCIETFSKDNQDVFVSATLRYRIDPDKVQDLLRNNPNYVDRSIRSRFLQLLKDETVKYTATDIATNREVIRAAAKARFITELAPDSITVEDLFLDNIDFRPEFKQAIEAKVAAYQNALAEQNKVAVAEAQAKQVAATALGAADALRITAQGQADANNLLTASLTPALIQYTAIQKLNDKISVVLLPSGNNFLLDPSKFAPAP